jgi:hypothetical protein
MDMEVVVKTAMPLSLSKLPEARLRQTPEKYEASGRCYKLPFAAYINAPMFTRKN